MEYERHHVRPISLYWPDHEANIMRIRKNIHKEIHDILNIPWKYIRATRAKINDRRVFNEHDLALMHKIQRMYFQNIDLLKLDAVQVHDKNFRNQILWRKNQINIINRKLGDDEIKINEKDIAVLKNAPHIDTVQAAQYKLSLLFQLEKEKLKRTYDYIKSKT